MANLTETSNFDAVYQIETTDLVLGGAGGTSNRQAQNLANRTKYLLDQFNAFVAAYTDASVLAKVKNVDGVGSGLDADLLDGQQGSYYANIPARLGYTPVQQGTGVGQNSNVIKIGWSGTKLKATVDTTDLGNVALESYVASIYAPLASPVLTGTPRVPTAPAVSASSQQIANLQFLTNYYFARGQDAVYNGITATGTVRTQSNGGNAIGNAGGDLAGLRAGNNNTGGAALMSFVRENQYGVYLGIDTDNVLKLGGWSEGTKAYPIWHAGNQGPGTGMNADLLDGQHGAFYQNAENLNSGTVPPARLVGAFPSGLNSQQFYTRLPNGLIVQGGRYNSSISEGTPVNIAFPVAFPNACISVQATVLNTDSNKNYDVWMQVSAISGSSAMFYPAWTGVQAGGNFANGFTWLAFGY